MLSFMLNDGFKTFNPIEEDGLDVFECLVWPGRCPGLQSSDTVRPFSYARPFERAESCRGSELAIKVGGEGVQASRGEICGNCLIIRIGQADEQ
jgi:hypothetical protein